MQVTRHDEPARRVVPSRASLRDPELVQRVWDDDAAAFEELCRRHVGAAWELAYAVTGQRRDSAEVAADAFAGVLRPDKQVRYDSGDDLERALLVATRTGAVEAARRPRRNEAGEMSDAGDASTTVNAGTWDGGLPVVTAAYRSLPERWRSVLWLVEVQRVGPAEAGAILGVSGNGLTQLSLRARAGMQERYLQAQLRGPVAEQCLPVLERLGDYVAASLAPAAMGDIDEHLQRCDACEQRLSDLDDLGAMLGRIAAPMPPTLVAMATTRWKLASNAATVASRARLGVLSFPNSGRKPLAGAALAVLGLGIIGAAVVSGPLLNHGSGLGGIAPAAAAPTEVNRVAAFENANPFLLAGGGIPAAVPTGSATSANPAVPSGSGATASPAGAGGGGAPSAGRGTTAGALPSAPGAPSTTLPKAPLPSVPTATVPLIPTTTLLSPTTVVPTTLPAPLSPLTIPTL